MNIPHKILVLRFSSIGDIVLSSPLLRCLRSSFPHSQIDYVTRKEYADLVRFNQNLNYTYEFDADTGLPGLHALRRKIRRESYDLFVDIHGSLRSRYIRAFPGSAAVAVVNKHERERAFLIKTKKDIYKGIVPVSARYLEAVAPLGVTDDGKGTELHIPDEIQFGISGKMAALRLNQFETVVGLCPSARHATKRWPLERYAELGIQLARTSKAKVILFGGSADVATCSAVAERIGEQVGKEQVTNFGGQLALLETASAMDYCDVVVTNDSGLMHIADARQRNLVAIFGSTVRQFGFFPQGSNSVVIENTGLYCRPCSHVGRPSCPEGHFRCMVDITVDEVLRNTAQLLARGR